MGVAAAGKTTIGRAASALTGVTFLDADDRHPPENIAKMAAGIALDDADRAPWLDAVGSALRAERPCIMACSALRRSYRDRLREHAPQAVFALLKLPRAELERRIAARADHFMPPELLDSQLAALEHPGTDEEVVVLDATRSVDELAAAVAALLAPRVD